MMDENQEIDTRMGVVGYRVTMDSERVSASLRAQ